MAGIIRFLVFSAFLLILPAGAAPPAGDSHALLLSCRTIRGKTAVVQKFLLLQRFHNADEVRPRFRIYDITVAELDPAALVGTQLAGSSEKFTMGFQKECQSEFQEVARGTTDNRSLSPML